MDMVYIGLGNPGPRYEKTRHNFGAWVLKNWVQSQNPALHWKEYPGIEAQVAHVGSVHCFLPMNGMNVAGQAVQHYAHQKQISPQQMVIIHDDLEIPLGQFTFKEGGSAAGHNGVRSIHEVLGTTAIPRVRIGIGRPTDTTYPIDRYVLEPFTAEEMAIIQAMQPELLEFLTEMSARFTSRLPQQ